MVIQNQWNLFSAVTSEEMAVEIKEVRGEVAIFSIIGCPFCIRTKGKLEDLNLSFFDINLDKFKGARQLMVEKTGRKTVPQIFFNGKHIGGWTDFNNLVS